MREIYAPFDVMITDEGTGAGVPHGEAHTYVDNYSPNTFSSSDKTIVGDFNNDLKTVYARLGDTGGFFDQGSATTLRRPPDIGGLLREAPDRDGS